MAKQLSQEEQHGIDSMLKVERETQSKTGSTPKPSLEELKSSLISTTVLYPWCTVYGPAYTPSFTEIKQLRDISISELLPKIHHRGGVLFARISCQPQRSQTTVRTVIVDKEGSYARLSLHNIPTSQDLAQVFPVGSALVIKEPFYVLASDGHMELRVDHPSDLPTVHLDENTSQTGFPDSDSTKTASDLKIRGNELFRSGSFLPAFQFYLRGLAAFRPDRDPVELVYDLFRNRANASFRLHRYEQSVADANASLVPNPTTEEDVSRNAKSRRIAGMAYYALGDYINAHAMFKIAVDLDPSNEQASQGLARCEQRLPEQGGVYDFAKMFAVEKTSTESQYASYVSKVEVRQTSTTRSGRALFAKEAMSAGDLVFVERAFCFVTDTQPISASVNMNHDSISIGPHAALLACILEKVLSNPAQKRRLLELDDGDYQPKFDKEVDGAAVVDTFRVLEIIENNAYGRPLGSPDVDCHTNKLRNRSVGLWLVAAAMMPSCIGNVAIDFSGDMMIARATKDIPVNSAIDIVNSHEVDSSGLRTKRRKANGLLCDCDTCIFDSVQSKDAKIKLLQSAYRLRDFINDNQIVPGTSPVSRDKIREGEPLYEEFGQTRHYPHLPRLSMATIGLWLCEAWKSQKDGGVEASKEIRQRALGVFGDLGYVVVEGSPDLPLSIDKTNGHACAGVVQAALHAVAASGGESSSQELMAFAREVFQCLHAKPGAFEEECYVEKE